VLKRVDVAKVSSMDLAHPTVPNLRICFLEKDRGGITVSSYPQPSRLGLIDTTIGNRKCLWRVQDNQNDARSLVDELR